MRLPKFYSLNSRYDQRETWIPSVCFDTDQVLEAGYRTCVEFPCRGIELVIDSGGVVYKVVFIFGEAVAHLECVEGQTS
jgi:hypothetical protein